MWIFAVQNGDDIASFYHHVVQQKSPLARTCKEIVTLAPLHRFVALRSSARRMIRSLAFAEGPQEYEEG
jgi:hypothetical protein